MHYFATTIALLIPFAAALDHGADRRGVLLRRSRARVNSDDIDPFVPRPQATATAADSGINVESGINVDAIMALSKPSSPAADYESKVAVVGRRVGARASSTASGAPTLYGIAGQPSSSRFVSASENLDLGVDLDLDLEEWHDNPGEPDSAQLNTPLRQATPVYATDAASVNPGAQKFKLGLVAAATAPTAVVCHVISGCDYVGLRKLPSDMSSVTWNMPPFGFHSAVDASTNENVYVAQPDSRINKYLTHEFATGEGADLGTAKTFEAGVLDDVHAFLNLGDGTETDGVSNGFASCDVGSCTTTPAAATQSITSVPRTGLGLEDYTNNLDVNSGSRSVLIACHEATQTDPGLKFFLQVGIAPVRSNTASAGVLARADLLSVSGLRANKACIEVGDTFRQDTFDVRFWMPDDNAIQDTNGNAYMRSNADDAFSGAAGLINTADSAQPNLHGACRLYAGTTPDDTWNDEKGMVVDAADASTVDNFWGTQNNRGAALQGEVNGSPTSCVPAAVDTADIKCLEWETDTFLESLTNAQSGAPLTPERKSIAKTLTVTVPDASDFAALKGMYDLLPGPLSPNRPAISAAATAFYHVQCAMCLQAGCAADDGTTVANTGSHSGGWASILFATENVPATGTDTLAVGNIFESTASYFAASVVRRNGEPAETLTDVATNARRTTEFHIGAATTVTTLDPFADMPPVLIRKM